MIPVKKLDKMPVLVIQETDAAAFRRSKTASKSQKYQGGLNRNHQHLIKCIHFVFVAPEQLYMVRDQDTNYHYQLIVVDCQELAKLAHRAGIPIRLYTNDRSWTDGDFLRVWNNGDEGWDTPLMEEFFSQLDLQQTVYSDILAKSKLDENRNNRQDTGGYSGQNQQRESREDGVAVAVPQKNKSTKYYVGMYREFSKLAKKLGLPFVQQLYGSEENKQRLKNFAEDIDPDNIWEANVLGLYLDIFGPWEMSLLWSHLDKGNAKQDGFNYQMLASKVLCQPDGKFSRLIGGVYNRDVCHLAMNRTNVMKRLVEASDQELECFPEYRRNISSLLFSATVPTKKHSLFPKEVENTKVNLNKHALFVFLRHCLIRMYNRIGRENLTTKHKYELIACMSLPSAQDVVWRIFRKWIHLSPEDFATLMNGNFCLSFQEVMHRTGGCAAGDSQRTMPHNNSTTTALQIMEYLCSLLTIGAELEEAFDRPPPKRPLADSALRDLWNRVYGKIHRGKKFLACGELTSQPVLMMLCDPLVGVVPNVPAKFLTNASIKKSGGPITYLHRLFPPDQEVEIHDLGKLLREFCLSKGITGVEADEFLCQCSKETWKREQYVEPRFIDEPLQYECPREVEDPLTGQVTWKFCRLVQGTEDWVEIDVMKERFPNRPPPMGSRPTTALHSDKVHHFHWMEYFVAKKCIDGLGEITSLANYIIEPHKGDKKSGSSKPKKDGNPKPRTRKDGPNDYETPVPVRDVVHYVAPPTLKFLGVEVDGQVVTRDEEKALLKFTGGPVSKFGSRPVHVIVQEFREQQLKKVRRKRGQSGMTAQVQVRITAVTSGGAVGKGRTNTNDGFLLDLRKDLASWRSAQLSALLQTWGEKSASKGGSQSSIKLLVEEVMDFLCKRLSKLERMKLAELEEVASELGASPPPDKRTRKAWSQSIIRYEVEKHWLPTLKPNIGVVHVEQEVDETEEESDCEVDHGCEVEKHQLPTLKPNIDVVLVDQELDQTEEESDCEVDHDWKPSNAPSTLFPRLHTTRNSYCQLPFPTDSLLASCNTLVLDLRQLAMDSLVMHPHGRVCDGQHCALLKSIGSCMRLVGRKDDKLWSFFPNERFLTALPNLCTKRGHTYRSKCVIHAHSWKGAKSTDPGYTNLLFKKKKQAIWNVYLSIILEKNPDYFRRLLGGQGNAKFAYSTFPQSVERAKEPLFVVFRYKEGHGSDPELYIGICSDGYKTRQRIHLYSQD